MLAVQKSNHIITKKFGKRGRSRHGLSINGGGQAGRFWKLLLLLLSFIFIAQIVYHTKVEVYNIDVKHIVIMIRVRLDVTQSSSDRFVTPYNYSDHSLWPFDVRHIPYELRDLAKSLSKKICEPEIVNLTLPFDVSPLSWKELYRNVSSTVRVGNGGSYAPADCIPKSNVAIIIPFRDRFSHLRIFLRHFFHFMTRQNVKYQVFVIEQRGNESFNRAMLMNVGYREALKRDNFTCFILHDVDLLPLNDRIIYDCSTMGPKHMASGIDKFGAGMPYSGYFGGACAFTQDQLQRMNGFSNRFWGWGGEDDDAHDRVRLSGQAIQRYPEPLGQYAMIRHGRDTLNAIAPNRFKLLQETHLFMWKDGLNNLKYEVVVRESRPMFHRLTVSLFNKTSSSHKYTS